MARKKKKKIRYPFRSFLFVVLTLVLLLGAGVLALDMLVRAETQDRIISPNQAAELENVDCVLVLGCGVHSDGTPSAMLEDRLKCAISLYEKGAAPKVLMSGDHGTESYDEVNAMKRYALDAGVPSVDIFMDHAGFSTYETVYRAKDIFGVKKMVIVTQEYHLYRALYIADALGIEAYGVSADYRTYTGQLSRDLREVLARVKDFFMVIMQPEPTYRGEYIPISGNGELTHDENSNYCYIKRIG